MTTREGTARGAGRAAQVDYVGRHLLPNAASLTRLLAKQVGGELSRTEAGVLNTLTAAPRRVTELAELEGLAQPTMTLVVQRLEQRGWVRRERHADDGRVSLVSLTERGRAQFDDFVEQVADVLRVHIEAMSDEQLAALETATDALGALVSRVQGSS